MGSHFIPQYYLKGFECSDEPGLIWMYDKVSKRFRKIAIKAAAQRPAFYEQETEKKLASIEGPGHAALGRLRRGEALPESGRAELALYIAVMFRRVPRGRQRARQLFPAAFEQSRNRAHSQVHAGMPLRSAKRSSCSPSGCGWFALLARRRSSIRSTPLGRARA